MARSDDWRFCHVSNHLGNEGKEVSTSHAADFWPGEHQRRVCGKGRRRDQAAGDLELQEPEDLIDGPRRKMRQVRLVEKI